MTKPTFIGIGAQKCASTWIYDILADHPDVVLSGKKELDFFSYFYDRGIQWYENNFNNVNQSIVAGEISPSYFHEPAVPERVYRHYPDARIIVALRDPVKRAISNHKHEVRVGHLTGDDLSLERGLKNNPTYIDQGFYASHLERWFEFFPKDQVFVILFDDIVSDKHGSARRIYQFLGIDEEHESDALHSRSNPSYVNRFKGLERFKQTLHGNVRKLGLGGIWKSVGKMGLRGVYEKLNKMPSEAVIPEIKASTMQELKAEFSDEITRLERMLDRDLSNWR